MNENINITKDPVYQDCFQLRQDRGFSKLGLSSAISWHDDPKRMAFLFSRYKFVAKMLEGYDKVLEIGCGDAFASRVVAQHVKRLVVTDFDPAFIDDAKKIMAQPWNFECKVHDILQGSFKEKNFNGAFSLDVLEHFEVSKEEEYFKNIIECLAPDGTFIVGMQTINSQRFASPRSKLGHVNCKSLPELKKLCEVFFQTCFGFCMNDEVVHTGFHEMANYIFVVCCHPKT